MAAAEVVARTAAKFSRFSSLVGSIAALAVVLSSSCGKSHVESGGGAAGTSRAAPAASHGKAEGVTPGDQAPAFDSGTALAAVKDRDAGAPASVEDRHAGAPPLDESEPFSPDAVDLMRNATQVTAYRLTRTPTPGQRSIAGRGVAASKDVPPAWRRRFTALVTSKGTLERRPGKRCLFDPGVALGFSDGRRELLIAMCFSCSDILFQGTDVIISERLWDFQAKRGELLGLGRRIFRDDPELAPVTPAQQDADTP